MSANPILKIKTGSSRPGTYTQIGNPVTSTTGLTAGELGAILTPNNYNFYIGNTFGIAVTFGCEVSTDVSLGISDSKISTQKALKTYIDTTIVGASSTGIMSLYATGAAAGGDVISLGIGASGHLRFSVVEFSSIGGVAHAITTPGYSIFENTTNANLSLLVTYQLGWTGFSSSQSYNTSSVVRSAWIQLGGTPAATRIYGFNTLLCPAVNTSLVGAMTGVQGAAAVIILTPGQTFTIKCMNHSGASTTTNVNTYVNTVGGAANYVLNSRKATNIQIVQL